MSWSITEVSRFDFFGGFIFTSFFYFFVFLSQNPADEK